MKKHFILLSALAVLLLCSCQKEEAVFVSTTAMFNTSMQGLDVQFINESTNASYYQWEFGDGRMSMEPSPKHSYDHSGIYNVQLRTTSASGNKDTYKRIITVTDTTGIVLEP